MIGLALDAVTAFSIKPIRLAVAFAFALAFLCVVTGVGGLLFATSTWGSTAGAAVLAVGVAGLGQVALLWVLGEYVGRIHVASLQRPLFVISEIKRSRQES